MTRLKQLTMLALAFAMAAMVAPAAAQTPAGTQSTLEQQNKQILDELKAIRQLLERVIVQPANAARPPVLDARVTFATLPTDRVLGNVKAPVTMVEFTDLQCPFCRQYHMQTFEQIKREYIDTGKVRYIRRDLPLETIHPMALSAARVARCAREQGRFWEMQHAILVNNARLSSDILNTLARDVGLDSAKLATCLADPGRLDAMIREDVTAAQGAGLNATPAFLIGRTQETGFTGERLMGSQPFATFDAKIKELLAAVK